MREDDIVPKLVERLRQIARDSGAFTIDQVSPDHVVPNGVGDRALTADILADVTTSSGKRISVIVEAKSVGLPAIVRAAASQLWSTIRRRQDAYGVVGIPFASAESRRVCEEMGVGLIDLAGNCLLQFGGVYVSIEGKPNPYPATRPLGRPFATKSTRGVRTLLCRPSETWTAPRLADIAEISVGLAYNLLRRLAELELVRVPDSGQGREFTLPDPERLLVAWAGNYDYRRSTARDYYSPDDVATNEAKLARYCEQEKNRYAFTLTSGAARVAPMLRYSRVFCYVERDWDDVARALGWKSVPSGPNVSLLEPYDPGVFFDTKSVNGANVVCSPQLYVDLASYKGRGEEAATAVLEDVLRAQWRSRS